MATRTNRRIKKVNVTKESIDQVNSILQDLPEKPKEKLSLREAVDHLQDQIKDALAKGYSYEDVAVMLTEQGIKISPSTLKRYVPAGKARAAKRKTAATGMRTRRSRTKSEGGSATDSGNGASPEIAAVESTDAKKADEAPRATRGRGKAAAKSKTEPTAKTSATTKSTTGRTRGGSASKEAAAKPKSTRTTTTRRRKK